VSKKFTCNYRVSFHLLKNSAQLVGLMQLTKQNCSHQPALMYTENYCTVKLFKLFEKCLTCPAMFLTFTITHILTFKLNTAKIYH